MSFWNDPGASFQGLMDDPWHSLENFGTTGLVPLIPYATGIVGGIYGGPAGAKAGGAAGQAGVDYFSGNSDARTGEGIFGSLFSGAGKGGLAYGGFDSLGGGDGIMGLFGGGDSMNPATGLDWMDTGSGFAGNGGYGLDDGGSFGFDGQGSIGSGGMNSLLSNLGLGNNSGSFAGQDAFSLPSSAYTPEYLNMLADYQGVDAGDRSYYDILRGNTEQGLYDREGLAQKASGNSIQDLLKKQAQQRALGQLTQSGSKLQEQNTAQQAEQNKMAQLQAMMRKGQNVDVVSSLLALLQDREQQSKQPRISLI
jgi:hypothetical protein